MRSKLVVGLLSHGAVLALLGATSMFGVGCAAHEDVAVSGGVQAQAGAEPADEPTNEAVVVQKDPPAEQVEVVPVAPSREHIWVKGHWHWNGADWVWVRGRWITRRVGMEYVPGHWERRPAGWVWIGAHWRRI